MAIVDAQIEYILQFNNFINNNNLFHLNRKWDKIK